MLVKMQLVLPRDARCVAVMREVATCVLRHAEVPEEPVRDVELAVTEACSNVVRHAAGADDYTVALEVGDDVCEIEVSDSGPGFEPPPPQPLDGLPPEQLEAESGRGLLLIRALVDDLRFVRQDHATKVKLVKRWDGFNRVRKGRVPEESTQAR